MDLIFSPLGKTHDRKSFDCGEQSLNEYLHQYASQHGAKVKLINPSPVASKALELALFNDSFDIRHE